VPVDQSRPHAKARNSGPPNDQMEWMRANPADVWPDLASPQVLDAFEAILNLGERRYLGGLMAPEAELGPMVKSFGGRLYFNLSQLRHVCGIEGIPPAWLFTRWGHPGPIPSADERPPRASIDRLLRAPDSVRGLWRHLRSRSVLRQHGSRTDRYLGRLSGVDPRVLSDVEVWSVLEDWFDDAPSYMQPVLFVGSVLCHEVPVRRVSEHLGLPFEQPIYSKLLSDDALAIARQALDLAALAEVASREPSVNEHLSNGTLDAAALRVSLRGTAFLTGFEQFLEQYGDRARYEYDWSLPRYREDALPLLETLRERLRSRLEIDAPAIDTRLSPSTATRTPRVRRAIRKIEHYSNWREQVQSNVARVLGGIRRWHLALAERFVERGWLDREDEYFFLQLREIAPIVNGQRRADMLRPIVAHRIAERERQRTLDMPVRIRGQELLQSTTECSDRNSPLRDTEVGRSYF
jgi:pyruvate,water dikinase